LEASLAAAFHGVVFALVIVEKHSAAFCQGVGRVRLRHAKDGSSSASAEATTNDWRRDLSVYA
jgi:hypothetical protein